MRVPVDILRVGDRRLYVDSRRHHDRAHTNQVKQLTAHSTDTRQLCILNAYSQTKINNR